VGTKNKTEVSGACILTLNGGSSSIRFAVYEAGDVLRRRFDGKLDRLGTHDATLIVSDPAGAPPVTRALDAADRAVAVAAVLDWLEAHPLFASITAVGHRVVHGMRHEQPELITPALLAQLRRNTSYAPDHLPSEIGLIEAVARRHPRLPQVACFDTAFHRTMPRLATLLPIPRCFEAEGIQRYGFHGLSYAYLMSELTRLGDLAASTGRVILAHLGSGASLAAVRSGQSIDTTMGFTPTGGLPMSTRSGDLDPGVISYLTQARGLTPARVHHMVNHESGLLGVSETSADMRDLLAHEASDPRAAEAVGLFCYQVRKGIGAFAAALGGLDTLVFAGGIGEHAPAIRARACAGLGFLGIELDASLNAESAEVISSAASRVIVRVIQTDEELMIARSVLRAVHGRGDRLPT